MIIRLRYRKRGPLLTVLDAVGACPVRHRSDSDASFGEPADRVDTRGTTATVTIRPKSVFELMFTEAESLPQPVQG